MTNNALLSPPDSPKAFLKARRPERFSDSIQRDVGRLNRAVLEHHLTTLNRRSQELVFEDFAKQLCEKVICPNLVEQTGPVAGGDGKVDTQTFPVSEQTHALWYIGINDNANKDRWAFAVSTQEEWKQKCRKDVRKIVSTNRNYTKTFCITNQYAKANQRSDVEDSLAQETGMDVRVLDISWILDQIFQHGYEQLAIDVLSIDIDWRREVEIGPNDYSKKNNLQKLKEDITKELNASDIKPHQLDWLLEEAVLSKELEYPTIESQGLFDRASRAARRFGNSFHQFRAHYQYAWAAYFWYEDMPLFEEQLQCSFDMAKSIDQSGVWGDIITLLGLYTHYCRTEKDDENLAVCPFRTDTETFLTKMVVDDARPSNSLMARAYIELLKLQTLCSTDEASAIFRVLLKIVQEGEQLVGFSFQELHELISAIDDVFGELDDYENLQDYLTAQATVRYGELQGSLIWLKRGAKRLESGKPYQAIKLLGKSLIGLYKEESRKDIVIALNILSHAYRTVGLPWASRANLLLAASLITDETWRSGDLIAAQVNAYIRIAKVELQLGRIDYALAWWRLACLIDSQIKESVISPKDYEGFDGFLAQCFLNADLDTLKTLTNLPDLLDKFQLLFSRGNLLYALGYEETVSEEYELTMDSEHLEFLQMVRDLDLGVTVPVINICEGRYASLAGSVMGCEISISFPMRTPLVELAETLLSVIEGFFSTCMVEQVIALESHLNIEITADDDDEICISHELDDSMPVITMRVLCSSFPPTRLNIAGQKTIQKWLHQFVIELFASAFRPKNLEKTFETMLGEDRGLERSVSFGACINSQQNIMGDSAVKDILALLHDRTLSSFVLQRSEPWDKTCPKIINKKDRNRTQQPGEGEPPKEMLDNENITHQDISIQGLIKPRLWDKTVWNGVGFSIYPDGTPSLTLVFKDQTAALAIFKNLSKELGQADETNRLRVSIIRNISAKSPAHYRVCIAENPTVHSKKRLQMIARKNTMTPNNDLNLNNFLASYNNMGRYLLDFAIQKKGESLPSLPSEPIGIMMSKLQVIEAWSIGPNDLEVIAIQEGDEPMIPTGIENPPIFAAQKRLFGRY